MAVVPFPDAAVVAKEYPKPIGKSKFNPALVICCVPLVFAKIVPFVPAVRVMPLPTIKSPYMYLLPLFNVLDIPLKFTFLNTPDKLIRFAELLPSNTVKLIEFVSLPPAVLP